MVKRIEKTQRDFLWKDTIKKCKFHLVRWNVVCKLVACGGLGMQSLSMVNKAQLGKWLWRLGDESQGHWRRIIIDKYRVRTNGWSVPLLQYRVSDFWRSVLSAKLDFDRCIHYCVNNG